MSRKQKITTKISFYKLVPTVIGIGSAVLTISGPMYLSASTPKVLDIVQSMPIPFVPLIDGNIKMWGSGTREYFSENQNFNQEATMIEMANPAIEQDFDKLFHQWKIERPLGADVLQMVIQPSYQRIIGMGTEALPLILKELEKKPDHWFWALYSITGKDPVLLKHQGNLREMAKDWIDWGRSVGYNWQTKNA